MGLLPTLLLAAFTSASTPAGSPRLARSARIFSQAFPTARTIPARFGGLEVAAGFAVPRVAMDDEENARRFLAAQGEPFGAGPGADLETVRVTTSPSQGGSALFQRRVNGLPVFGGELGVSWRPDGAITAVSGSQALATEPAETFSIGASEALLAAIDGSLGPSIGASSAAQGWFEHQGQLLPTWRITAETALSNGPFHAYVDGATGRLLYRVSLRHDAGPAILAYAQSPLEPQPAPGDPLPTPQEFALLGLASGATGLRGDRVDVLNCVGNEPGSFCDHLATPNGLGDLAGSFLWPSDPTFVDRLDKFAEQSAYYHVDAHSRFLDSLAPDLASARASGTVVGKVTAYVNVTIGDSPYDNAYYQSNGSGTAGTLVCGQGTRVDFAYDGEIIYHELTHAAVDATSGFESFADGFGFNDDPGALNEGTADTFAFANPNSRDPCLSKLVGAALGMGCLRRADNFKTCHGNGANDGSNPGRDGEVHDDGEIWSGFTWAIWSGAPADQRDAMAGALLRALAAVGSKPSFEGYAALVQQQATDHVSQTAGELVACTIAQRDLAGCADRALPVFSGERMQAAIYGFTRGRDPAPQQYFIDVPCGATGIRIQTGASDQDGRLYIRYGQPITYSPPGSNPTYDWVLAGNQADALLGSGSTSSCPACSPCSGEQTPFGPGRWYFLLAGHSGVVATVGLSLELASGAIPPARQPYQFGDGIHNVCAWGGGPTPSNRQAPVSNTPPTLTCATPTGPGTRPASCPNGSLQASGGCNCGGTASDSALWLGMAALLALGRRRRASHRPTS
jgi:MYXO-CTERM domain-containing protein